MFRAGRHGLTTTPLLAVILAGCEREERHEQPVSLEPGVDAAPVAETLYGRVRGSVDDGILTFKGIRYGADTAGTRFAAPAAPARWGALPATRFGDPLRRVRRRGEGLDPDGD